MDDLDLVAVGQPDDLLVQVEEDVLRLTLAVQRLVGQAEKCEREINPSYHG